MKNIIPFLQIAVSVGLIILILLQQKASGLGSTFGQEGGTYSTRRGAQKKIFIGTIVLAIAFVALALLNLFLQT